MAIWIGTVDLNGLERAVIADSVTERPLALPLFSDEDQALEFLEFADSLDLGDLRAMSSGSLERLHTAWLADREADALFAATSQQE